MFKKEDRYLVVALDDICNTINYYRGLRGQIKSVVVEHDWPEYNIVWKMIEDRCNAISNS